MIVKTTVAVALTMTIATVTATTEMTMTTMLINNVNNKDYSSDTYGDDDNNDKNSMAMATSKI